MKSIIPIALLFFLPGCSSSEPDLPMLLETINRTDSNVTVYPAVPTRVEHDRLIGQWLIGAKEEGGQLRVQGFCSNDEPGFKSISIPFYFSETARSKHSCAGFYNLHIIKTESLSPEKLNRAIYEPSQFGRSLAMVPAFETASNNKIALRVNQFGSFTGERAVEPVFAHIHRQTFDIGRIDPPFFYAITSPAAQLLVLGEHTNE